MKKNEIKGNGFKKPLYVRIAVVLFAAFISASTLTVSAAEPWQEAYANFLREHIGSGDRFMLHDIDGDDIPELFHVEAAESWGWGRYNTYVFTFIDGVKKPLMNHLSLWSESGSGSFSAIHILNEDNALGFFERSSAAHLYHFTLINGELTSQLVRFTQVTEEYIDGEWHLHLDHFVYIEGYSNVEDFPPRTGEATGGTGATIQGDTGIFGVPPGLQGEDHPRHGEVLERLSRLDNIILGYSILEEGSTTWRHGQLLHEITETNIQSIIFEGQTAAPTTPVQDVQEIPIAQPPTQMTLLSPTALANVVDTATAVQAVRNALAIANYDYVAQHGLLELFADNAIARAASVEVLGGVVAVNQATTAQLQATAEATRAAIYAMFAEEGYTTRRDLNATISFVTDSSTTQISTEPSTQAEQVIIRTPYYEIILPPVFMASDVSTSPLTISVNTGNSYTVAFSREVETPIRLAVPPLATDTNYQTKRNTAGQAIPSRFNPANGLLQSRISASDTFVVVENRVDFTDIQNLSQGMQQAIRELAAQEIFQGTAPGRFSPEDSVNRAQMSTLIMRMLGGLDPNADGNFNDVARTDWFFGAAGSANRRGIMTGTGGGNFSPMLVLPREQLTVVSTRVLRDEMGYAAPANPAPLLQTFTDRDTISNWATSDIALAQREGLILPRPDGTFRPSDSMTRGDVALMMHRLYLLLW
ncbi:MAG: S-layer homology domain-containing protein [Defluviitaleaceae bacterium]|nr:S-layer homology domain-containing protein [Defluviitaleaceae bacterium]